MYCIKCGVQLADTEKKCPLCNTVVYHPDIEQGEAQELYPSNKMPKIKSGRPFVCGAVIILFLIPLIVTLLSDVQPDGKIDWFGFVLGGLIIAYLAFALPMWFRKPNPIIFVPCDFAAVLAYLFYVNYATGGNWFWSFALPCWGAVTLITCEMVTLLHYLKRGRLYVVGGSVMAVGALVLMVEWLMGQAFSIAFMGWSTYPAISLFLIGGLLIYLAMNSVAREKIERKLFF